MKCIDKACRMFAKRSNRGRCEAHTDVDLPRCVTCGKCDCVSDDKLVKSCLTKPCQGVHDALCVEVKGNLGVKCFDCFDEEEEVAS